ncbi:MAG: hypothetical protein GQ570_09460 [Helicobacteraceae bacterium]|nr:hypothetical protein [Helicobacteraceae bacterium]
MYFKRYSIAILLFILIVSFYIAYNTANPIVSVGIYGFSGPHMPLAYYSAGVMLVMYIATIFHFSFYNFLKNRDIAKYKKDFDKFARSFGDALLAKENRSNTYKTEPYKAVGSIVDNATISLSDDFQSNSEELNEILSVINRIHNGEIVELKKYNLSQDSELVQLNNINSYKNGSLDVEEILNKQDKYTKELIELAFMGYIVDAPLYAIEKYKELMSKKSLLKILTRINSDENRLEIPNETIVSFFSLLELNEEEFLQNSAALSKSMIPDQRVKLFEMLSESNEIATAAYLYTLFDLEMIDKADEILESSSENDFVHFRAYRTLRENTNKFSIDIFLKHKCD